MLKREDLKEGCVVRTHNNKEWIYKEKVFIHGSYCDWALVSLSDEEYISSVFYEESTLTASYVKTEAKDYFKSPIDIIEVISGRTVKSSLCPHCGNQYYGSDISRGFCIFCPL